MMFYRPFMCLLEKFKNPLLFLMSSFLFLLFFLFSSNKLPSTVSLAKEVTECSKETVGHSAPPKCETPVKEETKPIATTPKLRGKRNVNQVECEKPHDEYSAEADDEMEEEIKLCNKKKLMVALKDINADKKLVEGSSVKTYALEQPEKLPHNPSESVKPSPPKLDQTSASNVPVVEKVASVSETISERHSVAVAKKTKKQKIIENDVECIQPIDERKRNDLKESVERLEGNKDFDIERKEKDETIASKSVSTFEVESKRNPTASGADDENELGSDDMEICDDTTNTTPAYEPPKFSSHPKSMYSKFEMAHTDASRDNLLKDTVETTIASSVHKAPEAEGTSSNPVSKPHEKWTNNRPSSSPEVRSVVVKTTECTEDKLPAKNPSTVVGATIEHERSPEHVVKSPINELRPNVIVDVGSEAQESPKQQVSPIKSNKLVESNEPKSKDDQDKANKKDKTDSEHSVLAENPKISNVRHDEGTVQEQDTSRSQQSRNNSTLELDVDSETNKPNQNMNRTDLVSPKEKSPGHAKIQLSPEKSRDSKNSVIRSVIEPNAEPSDCVPLSGSTADVSKNDETKTTTQDFCQRIDPNKTPQCDKTGSKVETKSEPSKSDHNSPTISSQTAADNSHRVQESVKTVIQPKEEPNRLDATTPDVNSANANQTSAESSKNRYSQQQSHSKSLSSDHKKSTSSVCSQNAHFDIKRESKAESKSNSGYGNENSMRRESSSKRESSKHSAGYASSTSSSSSSKNFSNESSSSSGSKSTASNSLNSAQMSNEKKHSSSEKKSVSSDKKSNSAEKKPQDMRANIDADLNKMRPQFAMNQLPNYHTAHQYYNLTPWEAYNYHSGYNLPHLDPSTQKSPTKFHKDLANSMYGSMTPNYLTPNPLTAQQSQQQQQQNQQQIQSNLQYQHQQQVGFYCSFYYIFFEKRFIF